MEELQKRVEQLEGQLAELTLPDAASSSAYTDVAEREIRMQAQEHMRTQARLVEVLTSDRDEWKMRCKRLEAELAELRAASDRQPVELILDDGSKYYGRVKNGRPHGPGKQTDMDRHKKIYEGQWADEKYDGVGVCYHGDGETKKYDGQWTAGKYHGQGVSYDQNGTKEKEGQWVDGRMHGQGTSYRANGKMEYQGHWVSGKYDGQGTQYDSSGSELYRGEWREGQMHGEGWISSITWGGSKDTGPLLDGQPHGQGISYHQNGKRAYEGQWRCGHKHGEGISYHDNGEKEYEGGWENGEWHGQGTASCRSLGPVFEGRFARGTATCGTFYSGCVAEQQWRAGQAIDIHVEWGLLADCGGIPDWVPNI
ncbi:unnamed protein product [Vitrella brassicaformis CCMP3155]|uniref:Uncharacterized protein n=1 Tax=Vitrella brassicaformis (strain CCMP3155) TaxID=1169540 RepID=A0A0G4FZP0_VITBC|nr:unnamed protein product [Vitrella brassicaformis CCMP3155]|eukprot:CEM20856.1 unnamed protein product [Vitrella brassicaformis CCMP3155]